MARQWRSRRSAILLGDVVLHIALLLWIVFGVLPKSPNPRVNGETMLSLTTPGASPSRVSPPDKPAQPGPRGSTPAVTATPAALGPGTTPPPSVEQRVEAILGVQSSTLNPIGPAAPASGSPFDPCDLTAAMQNALVANADAAAAARALPPTTLSLANAYMLWDAGWVPPRAGTSLNGLDPIRKVVVEQVMASTPECRDRPQVGPRVIVMGTDSAAVTLVIGSGVWRWNDLTSAAMQNTAGATPSTAVR